MGTVKSLLLGMCFKLGACTNQTSTVQTTERELNGNGRMVPLLSKLPSVHGTEECIGTDYSPKLEAVRVGFVGLGMRGPGAVERFTYIPGTQVVALL